jgi:uncharacterized protein (DUF2141 family)
VIVFFAATLSIKRSVFLPLAGLTTLLGAPSSGAAKAWASAEPPRNLASEEQRRAKKGASCTLVVEINKLRNAKGRVAVALFNSSEAFPEQSRALQGKLATISGARATVTFKGVKPGTYALAVLHDENKNNKMDFNLLGMPLEGYGFSNDAWAMFGPPSFEDASFSVKGKTTSKIKARYFSL